jgi:hypothetical protein
MGQGGSAGSGGCTGPELCNGLDDDCDGAVDEAGAAGCTTFFRDDDGDGYGVATDTRCLCAPAAPYSAPAPGDCDDASPHTHPDASESCNEVDDDCNGLVDDGITLCGCEDAEFEGHNYLFCAMPENWLAALTTCVSAGYNLVSIGGSLENAFVFDTANSISNDRWWLGLNDILQEGTFIWPDGSPVTYTNWGSGEPNNLGNEDCGQINRYYPDDTWNDEPCINRLFFICEER